MTKLFAILNLTPDSFSNDGKVFEKDVTEYINQLVNYNVYCIDIGAESTRPEAKLLNHKEEWERLEPYIFKIIKICKKNNIKISIDSRHHETIEKLADKIDYINDVSASCHPKMIELAKKHNLTYILMHTFGLPANKNNIISENKSAITQLISFYTKNIAKLVNLGLKKEQIILDPGIGFSKNAKQDFEIIRDIKKLKNLGFKLLVGHSRKAFIGTVTNTKSYERDYETLVISESLYKKQIDFIRVHNIEMHYRAFQILERI